MKICIPTIENGGLDDFVSEHFGGASLDVTITFDSSH